MLQKLPVFWRQLIQYNKTYFWMKRTYVQPRHTDLCSLKGGTFMAVNVLLLVLWLWDRWSEINTCPLNGKPSPQPRDGIFHMQADFTNHIFLTFHNQDFHAPGDRETNEAEKPLYSQLLQSNFHSECFMKCGKDGCCFCQNSKFPGLKP